MNIAFVRAAVAAAIVALAGAAGAQTTTVAGATAPGKGGVVETTKLTATVVAVDKATRDVTLKGPQGNELVVTAGPEVKNFDQLKAGDQVNVEVIQALTLELKKGGGLVVSRTDAAGAVGAKPGEKPAGVVGRQVTIVAEVVGVDPAKQVVTLKGPQRTVDLRIPNADQFKKIAKGDQVEATYTQAVAMAVQAAPKK